MDRSPRETPSDRWFFAFARHRNGAGERVELGVLFRYYTSRVQSPTRGKTLCDKLSAYFYPA